VTNQFGKYGVIKQEDFFNKKPEFISWALEVKKTNVDALGQMQMKDLFKDYVEDFNTATMPSEKYYDLASWDKKMANKRVKRVQGDEMNEAQRAALASFDDESARRNEIKNLQAKKQEAMINNELSRMRVDSSKVKDMRSQDQLRTHMDQLNKAGNIKEADKIKARLDPSMDQFGRPKRRHQEGEQP